ncbi:hypothetical protein DENIS_0842 [Desulfonema ishimotonii]|uniref:UspA domain-containing protein n=1 Tax=Desulfonema ishimotonii TaxID=45657 RepID=A0A401FSH7_9BACT|nr:universal stress protein [Desulfonema ishimotonii]GBC59900.1 hypothetical protein DENIS_0842 [Desulfonema ishimotonii]
MEKKVLLAVDPSMNSKYAIRYAVKMADHISELSYTLLHVQPHISQFLLDEARTDFRAQSALQSLKRKNAEKSDAMLKQYRADMVGMGVAEGRIEIQNKTRSIGLAKDIIDVAQEKRYDAVVVGRRGLSKVEEIFMGSLTVKLVEHSQVVPLWVVDGKVEAEKIMVAIDGSESSLRALDHVSFMFRNNPDVRITLLHVMPRLKDYCLTDYFVDDAELEAVISEGDKKTIEHFMALAYKKFSESGISKDQIDIRQVKRSGRIGETIVEAAVTGGYGTVVLGRRGADKAFFMGSVSSHVLGKISGRTIWLVS